MAGRDYTRAYARALGAVLDKYGLTARHLADALDRTPGTVSRWLGGAHLPAEREIAQISAALGLTAEQQSDLQTAYAIAWLARRSPHVAEMLAEAPVGEARQAASRLQQVRAAIRAHRKDIVDAAGIASVILAAIAEPPAIEWYQQKLDQSHGAEATDSPADQVRRETNRRPTEALGAASGSQSARSRLSILQAAYELTRLVGTTAIRSQLKDLLWNGRPDLGWLPGSARQPQMIEQARSQFGAMLVLEQTPALEESHRNLLAGAYHEMDALDRDCVAQLADWSTLTQSALPYADFPTNIGLSSRSSDLLANSKARLSLVREFGAHPAFAIALETARALGDRLATADPPPAVVHLHHQIETTTPGKIHGAIALLLADVLKTGSPERILMRNLAASVCLRASLGVLNQLVYQKCRDDKLVFIGKDNLANLSMVSDAFTESVYEAVMQPQKDREDRVQLGDLVLLQLADRPQLCRVEHLGLVIDSVGYDVPLRLRPIDENLNPYPRLLVSA